MDYEELWMRQKRNLLQIIAKGKRVNAENYDPKTYHFVCEGRDAADQLAHMTRMECELYFYDGEEELGSGGMEDDLK